jgi:hypothetical protein
MRVEGAHLLRAARRHLGERYQLGVLVPKDNANWRGPWDCAEFASWCVYQVASTLYGCANPAGDPASEEAYTGYWERDARSRARRISVEEAAVTPGALILRVPGGPAAVGHIVFSMGDTTTIEAHSSQRGVIQARVAGRRWDMGILIPEVRYTPADEAEPVPSPKVVVIRLTAPPMRGPAVRAIQRALAGAGVHPGPIDGRFGAQTQAAVVAFQLARRLVPDGEVGPQTARALGVELDPAGGGRPAGRGKARPPRSA